MSWSLKTWTISAGSYSTDTAAAHTEEGRYGPLVPGMTMHYRTAGLDERKQAMFKLDSELDIEEAST